MRTEPKTPLKSADKKDPRGRKAIPPPPKAVRPKPVRKVLRKGNNRMPVYNEKAGNQRIELSPEEIERMKAWTVVGVSVEDIALMLGISKDTIERNYMDVLKSTRVIRNAQLRRKQYDLAMQGNVGMLVWLGKQWLGQSDEMTLNLPDGTSSTPVIELVFVDSDGDGRPKTIDGVPQLSSTPALTEGEYVDGE